MLHVLAHVAATAHLPSSLCDVPYQRFVEQHAGPAGARQLGEDAELLGRLLPTHQSLARAQLLAWLFDTIEQVRAASALELSELGPEQVAEPRTLELLIDAGPAIEVLRCAAELELEVLEGLAACEVDEAALEAALREVTPVAPFLTACQIMALRPLRLRGRIRGREIWLGAAGSTLGPDLHHAVWQACHEATVGELSQSDRRLPQPLGERAVERVAVVLLGQRAQAAGRSDEHARWLAHFGPDAPSAAPSSLDEPARRLLEATSG